MRYWRTALIPTGLPNTIQGGELYAVACLRPGWYWAIRRLREFVWWLWRPVEEGRSDWRTAWDISKIARGLTERDLKEP